MDHNSQYSYYKSMSPEQKLEQFNRYNTIYQTPKVLIRPYNPIDELQDIHPDIERFYYDYIPFESYVFDEVHKDTYLTSDGTFDEFQQKFVTDRYPDKGFTPHGWLEKITGMNKKEHQRFHEAFYPDCNEEACESIRIQKERICKNESSEKSCENNDNLNQLKKKHDSFMNCHNIRIIESFSNCKTKSSDKPIQFRSNAMNHTSQKNQQLRSAAKCVDIYVDKVHKSLPKMVPPKYKKYRKSIRRIRTISPKK